MNYRLVNISSFEIAKRYRNSIWCLTEDLESFLFYSKHSRLFVIEIDDACVESEKKILLAPDMDPAQVRNMADQTIDQFSEKVQELVNGVLNDLK